MNSSKVLFPLSQDTLSAMYERFVFSYRGINLRNRLNHECANSTTHRRVLNEGSLSINFFSSPRGRMWGMNPWDLAASSLPTYAASRQRFCGVSFCSGATTLFFSNESRKTLSCRLAPLTTNDKGTPFSSTSKCRFVPFFPPVRRVWADGFFRKRCLMFEPSTDFQRQAIPSMASYSASPRCHMLRILPSWPTAEIFDEPSQSLLLQISLAARRSK